MSLPDPSALKGYPIHLVGIKGTGMTALAEILVDREAAVRGSDGPETFYTDEILQRLGIEYAEAFAADNIAGDTRLVIHSAAYERDENPELIAAARRGIPLLSYPEALGLLSRSADSSAVSGSHGKTTTAALSGAILKAWELPVTVLAGSEVADFSGRSTLILGRRHFVAETCEYRRHFLHFHARRIVVTAVEADHLDYFRDFEDVLDAFTAFCRTLPAGGELIFDQDDPGARSVAEGIGQERDDLRLLPYGQSARGAYRIADMVCAEAATMFTLSGWEQSLHLSVPGAHTVHNAAAALALSCCILEAEGHQLTAGHRERAARALADFKGSRRRSEVLGSADGVLFMDDYGHHPTEILTTLAGLKSFYPGRRIIVDFMSHTYSRTGALLREFGTCFRDADLVLLHRIYASAREVRTGDVDGRLLYREVKAHHPRVVYFEEPDDAVPYLQETLRPGDLFITMGAGDNWRIGRQIFESRVEAAR